MCGIAGYTKYGSSLVNDEIFFDVIKYRGRDSVGVYESGLIRFFHSRLEIIGKKDGTQPITSSCGRYTMLFNGEVYNYKELMQILHLDGVELSTNSDSLVLMECLIRYGLDILPKINGFFAIAFWDDGKQKLWLCTDHMAKKPLYYIKTSTDIYFSSSIKSFYGIQGYIPEICTASTSWFLEMGYFPLGRSIFKSVKSLKPGAYIEFDFIKGSQQEHFHTLRDYSIKDHYSSEAEVLNKFENTLTEAIKLRLDADVPIALSISGGIDSTTIEYLVREKLGQSLPCYMIDHENSGSYSPDLAYVNDYLGGVNTHLNFINFEVEQDILPVLDEALAFFDQPTQQVAASYSYILYKEVKKCAGVILTGIGADEIFSGYKGDERYHMQDLFLPTLRSLNKLLKFSSNVNLRFDTITAFQENLKLRFSKIMRAEDEDLINIFIKELCFYYRSLNIKRRADLFIEHSLIMHNRSSIFQIPDICGMAAQVEVRSPFLDINMVNFAIRLPRKYKCKILRGHKKNKYLMRKYYEKNINKDLAWKKKYGMGSNLNWHTFLFGRKSNIKYLMNIVGSIREIGMDPVVHEQYIKNYHQDLTNGLEYSKWDDRAVNAFLLGLWVNKYKEVLCKN